MTMQAPPSSPYTTAPYVPTAAPVGPPPLPAPEPLGHEPAEIKTGKVIGLGLGLVALTAIVSVGMHWWMSRIVWDEALLPYVAFVEETRGYEFKEGVDVEWTVVSESLTESINDATADYTDQYGEAALTDYWDPWAEAYRMLGLYDPAVSLAADTGATSAANSFAYYDPATQLIVLPEGDVDVVVAHTIVHELTHALQHQHGMLGEEYDITDFDSADGASMRRALVEGDAERVAEAWLASMPLAEQDEYWRKVDAEPAELPTDDFLTASFYAPYALGPPVVNMLLDDKGPSLDDVLTGPLGSSERLVDPLGSSPDSTHSHRTFDNPLQGRRIHGDLGPVVWFQALAPHIGVEQALTAVRGYDNDAFFAYEDDGSGATCVRYQLWFDNPGDTAEFRAAIRSLGAAPPSSDDSESVLFDQCTPLGDPSMQSTATLTPLIWNVWLIQQHLESGLSEAVASCAALAQAITLPVDRETDLPGWEDALAQSEVHVDSCDG